MDGQHTNRTPAERALYQSELNNRQLVNGLPVAIYTCDAQGRVTLFNREAADLWGREPKIGQDLWCGSWRIYTPDGQPMLLDQCPMARTLREGRSIVGEQIIIERPDGTRRHVLAHPQPLFDDDGTLIGAATMLIDVTDRKGDEEIRARLAAIVESSSDAIVSKTLDGIITSWNSSAERLFGYTAAEAIGKPITMIIPPQWLDEERQILNRLRHGERIEHFETIRRAKDGRLIDISLTVSPVRDDHGRIIGASKVARDITDQKLAHRALQASREALRQSDQRKNEFLATLAHELRNPLAPIRSALEVMRTSAADSDAAIRARQVIERQVQQLVRLVDDLLDMSRISQGKIAMRKERITLSAAIENALEGSRPLIEAAGHRFTLNLPEHPIHIDGDLTRLAQSLLNLLNNAVKFTDPGGHITLGAAEENGWAVIRVRDTGVGIPPQMLLHVFDLFTQVDQSIDRANGGLGIGLTLVKNLIEMHGGTVQAQSEGPGRGSEFVVRLPIATAPNEQSSNGKNHRLLPRARRRILLADDNRDAAESMALMLELAGHQVRTVHDGTDAIKAGELFLPEVVLLDLGMPGLNGYDTARTIRKQSWGKDVLMVALTGWGMDENKQLSREAGFDHHLVKPAEPEALELLIAADNATVASSPASDAPCASGSAG